jgi:hypothetical protein
VKIKLSPREIILAAHAGIMRTVKHNASRDRQNAPKDQWRSDIEGCCGEYALSKYLNIHWNGGGYEGMTADAGNSTECRTASKHHYRLILHPEDHDDRKYWLLTGRMGHYIVQGWILGRDGKKDEYWEDVNNDDRPAFYVPNELLNRPEEDDDQV